jgi:HEAT repeat protein
VNDDKNGAPRSLDPLNTRALHQKREYVRELASRGDATSLSMLVECLGDESWYTRDLAEEELVKLGPIGGGLVVPLLSQGLWFTRTSAARILGRCAHRPAVPALLELMEDANRTVAEAVRDALIAIGRGGGAASIAQGLHRLAPALRKTRLELITRKDRTLGERIERLSRSEEIVSSDESDLSDDSPLVRSAEDGVEWEVLTGPATPKKEIEEGGAR